MNKESIKVSEKGRLARHIEGIVADHPTQSLNDNTMLTGMVLEFAMSGQDHRDVEWVNQIRVVTLN